MGEGQQVSRGIIGEIKVIDRLRIQNFQCHSKLDVELDPAITTIIGPSDVGKSSVLRALRWLVLNRPRGDSFIRDGWDECSVKIKVDGHTIERKRGKVNTYRVARQEYKAFGNDVPETVSSLLNLGEDNFQGQHDPSFWFSLTPGEVAKRLNRIVDLEVIDNVMAEVLRRLRKLKAERDVVAKRLGEAAAEKKRLRFVPNLEREFGQLMKFRKQLKHKREWVDSLGKLMVQIEEAKQRADRVIPDMAGLRRLKEEWTETYNRVDRLGLLLRGIERQTRMIDEANQSVREANARLEKETEGRCPVCGGPLKSSPCPARCHADG